LGYARVAMSYRAVGMVLCLAGCSSGPAGSPFAVDAGPVDAPAEVDARADAVDDRGIPLGGPCLEDRQCNDGVECTFDTCNVALRRCQNVPDDSRCQNGVFCDGVEVCDASLGCRRGQTMTCGDDKTCTIDRCIEASRSCTHVDRDADGDGNPDGHCVTGGDCDDADPTVFTGHPEVCGNRKDDNCDGQVDETPCQTPTHDTCLDPLLIQRAGVYELETTAAAYHYGGTCAPMDPGRRDVVAALEIAGDARDFDVVAEAPTGVLSIGVAGQCDRLSTELACASGLAGPAGNTLARVRLRSLAPGAYPLYVWTDRDEKVLLHVTEGPPTTAPTNETCGTAAPIAPGVPVFATLAGTAKDIASRCAFKSGDLVYAFTLTDAQDVSAYAASLDGYGVPIVSLRRAGCARIDDEIACGSGAAAKAYARALAPGTYYLGVGASAPTDAKVELVLSPPTAPPSDDRCDASPRLVPGRTLAISLQNHTDDVEFACSDAGAIDAAYALELAETSDVLLVMRFSSGDIGTVALARATCDSPALACVKDAGSPVRASQRSLAAGSYRAVVETRVGNPVQLTALVRPAAPPSLVPFADTCASATVIDERGGFFQGTTANAQADYSASCDTAGTGPAGAPDQMLKLTLSAQRRVVLDMQGSSYATLLDVRKGDTCPGAEVPRGCSAGYVPLRSFLDMTLDPGTYWVQVDGYAGEQGTWFLDVRVFDP
jgi:Putative metal-binding motif